MNWQATGGEKFSTNTTRFRFLVYFALFVSWLNYNELAVKVAEHSFAGGQR